MIRSVVWLSSWPSRDRLRGPGCALPHAGRCPRVRPFARSSGSTQPSRIAFFASSNSADGGATTWALVTHSRAHPRTSPSPFHKRRRSHAHQPLAAVQRDVGANLRTMTTTAGLARRMASWAAIGPAARGRPSTLASSKRAAKASGRPAKRTHGRGLLHGPPRGSRSRAPDFIRSDRDSFIWAPRLRSRDDIVTAAK